MGIAALEISENDKIKEYTMQLTEEEQDKKNHYDKFISSIRFLDEEDRYIKNLFYCIDILHNFIKKIREYDMDKELENSLAELKEILINELGYRISTIYIDTMSSDISELFIFGPYAFDNA